jgi:hypothetical protein
MTLPPSMFQGFGRSSTIPRQYIASSNLWLDEPSQTPRMGELSNVDRSPQTYA